MPLGLWCPYLQVIGRHQTVPPVCGLDHSPAVAIVGLDHRHELGLCFPMGSSVSSFEGPLGLTFDRDLGVIRRLEIKERLRLSTACR